MESPEKLSELLIELQRKHTKTYSALMHLVAAVREHLNEKPKSPEDRYLRERLAQADEVLATEGRP